MQTFRIQSNPAPQKQNEVAENQQSPEASVQKPKENTVEGVFTPTKF